MEFLGAVGFHLLLVLLCLLGESRAIHWTGSLQDGDVINTCKDAHVTFPWKYEMDVDDEAFSIADVQWYFDGNSQELIGIWTHGQFLAYPAFSGRVSLTEHTGLILSGVLPGDNGNYTVVVKGHWASGQYFELKQTITLNVSDQVMYQHGQLRVSRAPEPVIDPFSGQWAVQLVCGLFVFQGQPTYDVHWISPDGLLDNSTGFNGNYFTYLLTNPIQGGSYTCRVPRQHSCVNGQGLVDSEDSIPVDAMEARVTLLEKGLSQTEEQLKNVTAELEENIRLRNHVRLVGGSSSRMGRVEVWGNGSWGTVCDDSWDNRDAKVVCNMLGFFEPGAAARSNAAFGPGSGPILLDEVACTGREDHIFLCGYHGFGKHDCSHSEDAGVICVG